MFKIDNGHYEWCYGENICRLTINKSVEFFEIDFSFWKKEDYITQWKECMDSIISGCKKGIIITSISNPETANIFLAWILYVDGNNIYVQNIMIIVDDLDEIISEDYIRYEYIHSDRAKRKIIDEEGNEISEWIINMDDVIDFLYDIDADMNNT
jgi:hypothetical protein